MILKRMDYTKFRTAQRRQLKALKVVMWASLGLLVVFGALGKDYIPALAIYVVLTVFLVSLAILVSVLLYQIMKERYPDSRKEPYMTDWQIKWMLVWMKLKVIIGTILLAVFCFLLTVFVFKVLFNFPR